MFTFIQFLCSQERQQFEYLSKLHLLDEIGPYNINIYPQIQITCKSFLIVNFEIFMHDCMVDYKCEILILKFLLNLTNRLALSSHLNFPLIWNFQFSINIMKLGIKY